MNPSKIMDGLLKQSISVLKSKKENEFPDIIKTNVDVLISKIVRTNL